ncbi:MAG: glycosyltransferase family 2 protein [Bacteroidales bacterium]|nr:glycosyltransferase family 2 protein [Bacteroidales bacterium]
MSILFYIALFVLIFSLFRFLVALLNYISRPILPYGRVSGTPLVSVLIPARNEEHNIASILGGLLNQTYSNITVTVYNDQSTDETAHLVQQFIKEDKRVSMMMGEELPTGWLGKNYACHRLAMQAQGEYLLFLDADVKVEPHLVENAVAYMQRKRLVLLSMFPRQQLISMGEKLVVPSMNWILLSLLFLRLVRWSTFPSLAAANGQMMLFDAKMYSDFQWHSVVRHSRVEDIAISRLIKRKRLRMATLLGTDDISCRMYGSYTDAINGFTKNVTAFFGGSLVVTVLFALLGTLGPFIVLFGLPFPFALLFFTCLIASRIFVTKLSEQSVWINVLLWPVQQVAFLHLVLSAIRFSATKKLIWKGRGI